MLFLVKAFVFINWTNLAMHHVNYNNMIIKGYYYFASLNVAALLD